MSRKNEIVKIARKLGRGSASQIHDRVSLVEKQVSLVTIRREIQALVNEGVLAVSGAGRSTTYSLTTYGMLTDNLDAKEYCSADPDTRNGSKTFNFDLLSALNVNPFSVVEQQKLKNATDYYIERVVDMSTTIHDKELERFVIELSWKSSKIEGNTYTLLDTEKLILEASEAPGHDHKEARMILNHKKAFDYIRKHSKNFRQLTRASIEDVHKLLVSDLGVTHNLRKKPVGVTGSIYRPLDNAHQISEAIDLLVLTVNKISDYYAKALAVLVGISYIQPFEDGNKRTARLMANAILLAHGLAPLSYRSVTEEEYREATLVFYELNSLVPFRKIFVAQYDFAARNYLVGK